MRYLSVAETAKIWNISERSVRNYCAQGRVAGAFAEQMKVLLTEYNKKKEK